MHVNYINKTRQAQLGWKIGKTRRIEKMKKTEGLFLVVTQ